MFWKVETRSGLYVLFKTVCDIHSLIPEDNYTIPAEAEGGEPAEPSRAPQKAPMSPPQGILKRTEPRQAPESEDASIAGTSTSLAPNATARRHRQTPSKGALVDTVMEENEDEDGQDASASHRTDRASPNDNFHSPRPLARADTRIHIDSPPPKFSADMSSATIDANLPASPPQTSPTIAQTHHLTSSPPKGQNGLGIQQATSEHAIESVVSGSEPAPVSTSKPFAPFPSVSFSPVSPKAATFEEMEKELEGSASNYSSSHNAANETEGKVAGETAAGEGDDAAKTVED